MSAIQQLLSSYKTAAGNWLLTGLVSYYKFDESSWNAADSKGSFTLTNNWTATYSAWLLNNAVTTDTAKYLSTTSQLWLNASGQNFTFAFWIKPTATISTQQVFFNHTDVTNHNDIALDWFSSNVRLVRTRLWVLSDIAQWAFTFSAWTTYCIVCKYNWSTLSLRINNWTAITAASTWNGTVNWTDWYAVGSYKWGSAYYKWQVDEMAIASRAWSTAEETTFYNSGSPLPLSSYS